jgi:hypothetical protein
VAVEGVNSIKLQQDRPTCRIFWLRWWIIGLHNVRRQFSFVWVTISCWKKPLYHGFLQVLRFPLPVVIPPTATHSSSIIRGWCNRLNSGHRAKWTQSHPTPHPRINSTVEWLPSPSSQRWGCLPSVFVLISYLAYSLSLKMKAVCFSETSVHFTGLYIPENSTLRCQHCEDLTSKWCFVRWTIFVRLATLIIVLAHITRFVDPWLIDGFIDPTLEALTWAVQITLRNQSTQLFAFSSEVRYSTNILWRLRRKPDRVHSTTSVSERGIWERWGEESF